MTSYLSKCTISLFLFFTSTHVFSCDCEWEGNMIELSRMNETLAWVYITERLIPASANGFVYGVKAKVVQTIKGNLKATEIIIWRGLNTCHESVDQLQPGESHFVLLKEGAHAYEEVKSLGVAYAPIFVTNFCGQYSMKFESDSLYTSPYAGQAAIGPLFVNDFLQKIDQPLLDLPLKE